jgi:hypothetical protein
VPPLRSQASWPKCYWALNPPPRETGLTRHGGRDAGPDPNAPVPSGVTRVRSSRSRRSSRRSRRPASSADPRSAAPEAHAYQPAG